MLRPVAGPCFARCRTSTRCWSGCAVHGRRPGSRAVTCLRRSSTTRSPTGARRSPVARARAGCGARRPRARARGARSSSGIPPDERAERLSPEEFRALAAEAGRDEAHARSRRARSTCACSSATREDGRHELVTLFESVSLADELELTAGSTPARPRRGRLPGGRGPNLVARALAALREPAAGTRRRCGSRSTSGSRSPPGWAAARPTPPRRCGWPLSSRPAGPRRSTSLAATLGADVPSQLVPGLVLGTGAGDIVEPFEPLAAHAFVIVPLPVALSTADVYREADRLGLPADGATSCARPTSRARRRAPATESRLPDELLVNDLEPAAISLCPAIAAALERRAGGRRRPRARVRLGPDGRRALLGSRTGPTGAGAAAASGLSATVPGAAVCRGPGRALEFGLPQVCVVGCAAARQPSSPRSATIPVHRS